MLCGLIWDTVYRQIMASHVLKLSSYTAFHNILRDYKNLLKEPRRTHSYETCTNRKNNSKLFSPATWFSSYFTFLPLGDASLCSDKMAAPGEKLFCVLEYHTVSLWLLCNVHFVQSIRPTIATWPRWPKGTDNCSSEEYRCTHVDACVCVCGKNLNIVSMCAVSPAVHTTNISS